MICSYCQYRRYVELCKKDLNYLNSTSCANYVSREKYEINESLSNQIMDETKFHKKAILYHLSKAREMNAEARAFNGSLNDIILGLLFELEKNLIQFNKLGGQTNESI